MKQQSMERSRTDRWWPELPLRRLLDWGDVSWPAFDDAERMLRVEEFADEEELVVRAELPGIDPDKDVQVHLRNHVLEIRAERKESTEHKDEGAVRSEFLYGSFFRRIPLPPSVQESDVHATYKDGILEVRMPLDGKQAEATKIDVARE
jgi:HSP20 family protein